MGPLSVLAKKGTRVITVGGRRYRWRMMLADYQQSYHQVVIQPEEGGQRLSARVPASNFVTPRLVHRMIERAAQLGWSPDQASGEIEVAIETTVAVRASPHLDTILAALRTDRRQDALVAALNAWLGSRVPAFAEFIEHLGESMRDPKLRHDEASWTAELDANRPLTQEALDFMFDADPDVTAQRARRLVRGRPQDPRVARHLYQGLIAPLHLYHGARELLETAADIIGGSRDHGLLEALRGGGVALLARHAGGRKKWFVDRAARAIEAIDRSLPLGEPYLVAGDPMLEEIRIQLGISTPPVPDLAPQLLAAIYADPTDDDLRRVYADLLLEHGDARGEMIHLQLEEALSEEGAARLKKLLEVNTDRWLGTLSGWIAAATFERGFPVRAQLSYEMWTEDFFPDAAWATLEEIALPYRNVDTDAVRERVTRFLSAPSLSSLRSLREASIDLVEVIAPLDLHLERLHLMTINQIGAHALVCDRLLLLVEGRFPALKRLELGGWPPDQLERLRTAFGKRMEIIGV